MTTSSSKIERLNAQIYKTSKTFKILTMTKIWNGETDGQYFECSTSFTNLCIQYFNFTHEFIVV